MLAQAQVMKLSHKWYRTGKDRTGSEPDSHVSGNLCTGGCHCSPQLGSPALLEFCRCSDKRMVSSAGWSYMEDQMELHLEVLEGDRGDFKRCSTGFPCHYYSTATIARFHQQEMHRMWRQEPGTSRSCWENREFIDRQRTHTWKNGIWMGCGFGWIQVYFEKSI